MDEDTYARYSKNARRGANEYDFKNLALKLLAIMEA